MTPEEQVAVATVARYHRGTAPKKSHEDYGGLDRALRRRVKRLAAILRVADGFDRGHAGAVARIKVRWLGRAMRLTAVPARARVPLRLELWGASRKAALLEEVAGSKVEIVAPDGQVITTDDDGVEIDVGSAPAGLGPTPDSRMLLVRRLLRISVAGHRGLRPPAPNSRWQMTCADRSGSVPGCRWRYVPFSRSSHAPRLSLRHSFEQRVETRVQRRIFHRHHRLDTPVEVARHPVR